MIKLIVSDMDGTLLDDNKKIDEEIYTLLPKMKALGMKFVVASGRQYPSLRDNFRDHLEDIVIIAENGAFIVENDKELYAECMTEQQIGECLEAVRRTEGAEALVCAKHCSYTDNSEMYEHLIAPPLCYKMRLVDDLHAIEDDIIKVSVMERSGKGAKHCYEKIRPLLGEGLDLVISGNTCLDTGIVGVNKGTAIRTLQEMWKITPEETMVFGDQYNDVTMFSHAYYSFAMEGAAEGVKKQARYLAGSNNEGGVVRAIREYTGVK